MFRLNHSNDRKEYIGDSQKFTANDRLGESGLSGAYNSTIAKLILSSNHGMHEKSEVENKSEYVVQVTEVESRL